jgi:hypothetical protein
VERNQMLRLFEAHREAEAARDLEGILNTFVADPFLDTTPLARSPSRRRHVRRALRQRGAVS